MTSAKSISVMCALTLLATGCGDRKEEAERSLVEARESLETIQQESGELAIPELESAEKAFGELESALAAGDYGSVTEGSDALARRLRDTSKLVAERQIVARDATAAAVARWNELNREVPRQLQFVELALAARERVVRTTADREALADSKATAADLRRNWMQANSSFLSGNALDAVDQAEDVSTRAKEFLSGSATNPG
jgi:hypothetical protein